MLKMPCSSFSRRSEARRTGIPTRLASLLAAALPQGVLNILRGHDGI